MKLRILRGTALFSSLVLIASLLVMAGCSSDSSVSPIVENPVSLNKGIGQRHQQEQGESDGLFTIASINQPIEAKNGGIINIPLETTASKFIVAPDGVKENVEISVDVSKTVVNGRTAVIYEFGPEGLEFESPSVLQQTMSEINPHARFARLYYYNQDTENWDFLSIRYVRDGKIEFDIHHFSKYAISD